LGYERASRVSENQALAVERIAAAEKDRDMGTLDKVKAAKELTEMDLTHIERAVSILKMLQEKNEPEKKVKGSPKPKVRKAA
jgi:hypothetical protein